MPFLRANNNQRKQTELTVMIRDHYWDFEFDCRWKFGVPKTILEIAHVPRLTSLLSIFECHGYTKYNFIFPDLPSSVWNRKGFVSTGLCHSSNVI